MRIGPILAAALFALPPTFAQPPKKDSPNYTRTEDVIYGRKFGTALVMDVFAPKEKANGRGVIWCVSGGWVSEKYMIDPKLARPLLDRGYVVFMVTHGAQPKYTIPEILEHMHTAVRFIKANATKYAIDPDKLGISGMSAGGHLSLMQGNAPEPGEPDSPSPLYRQSTRVAAVACFFPPTDFLNYGKDGEVDLGEGRLKPSRPAFDFWERARGTNRHMVIQDQERRKEIGKQISPVYHVTKGSAPALIMHGDKDEAVPIQQAERIVARYREVGVPCELVVKKGAGHVWRGMDEDMPAFADWFDKHLK